MLRRFTFIIISSMFLTLFIQDMGMTRRVFDTELVFNPRPGQSYHYAQMTVLSGSEISFQRVAEFGGTIQAIYDETCLANANGLISKRLQFQTYNVLGEVSQVWDEQPYGGPWGGGRNPWSSAPSPDLPDAPRSEQGLSPEPMQEGGGGGLGPGGSWGGRERRDDAPSFRITPILETQLNYTIDQSGRMLDMEGLDLIGDFEEPQNHITVRQIFQSSHFLTVPSYEIHVGESWRGPFFWNIPFVGETRKFDMQYTLEEISIQERFRLANISFYGIDQFSTVTTDERWDNTQGTDIRIDSDISCDITITGNILFDIDRGIVVAIGDDIRSKQWTYYTGPGTFPRPWGNNYQLATIVVDRMDTKTPLGNVLDNEPVTDHIIQDMVWRTWLILE